MCIYIYILPIVLPIGFAYCQGCASSRVPGWTGSQAGLAWLKMQLGLGGGERGNFMYLNHNFSLVTAKQMLDTFVHINFSIRVFWQRRGR